MSMTETQFKYVSSKEYLTPPIGGHSACAGCGEIIAMRYLLKVLGQNVQMVIPPGCAGSVVYLPALSLVPTTRTLSTPFMTTATIAAGLAYALQVRGENDTPVVAWTGDGATFDIGLACLSGAAERNENILYVCYDNEGYMNTGNQRSSATPQGARTATSPEPSTKAEHKKDIMQIMAAHGVPYATTASIAYPDDFMAKIRKAKDTRGFRFIYILSPCPTGWFYRSEKTIELARLAVETRLFPLYEIEYGTYTKINRESAAIPIEEYIKPQGRFRSITQQQIEDLKKQIEQKWQRLHLLLQK